MVHVSSFNSKTLENVFIPLASAAFAAAATAVVLLFSNGQQICLGSFFLHLTLPSSLAVLPQTLSF